MKKYIACYSECGESADIEPMMLGVFDTREEAEEELKTQMENLKYDFPEAYYNYEDFQVSIEDFPGPGYEWSGTIFEIEL